MPLRISPDALGLRRRARAEDTASSTTPTNGYAYSGFSPFFVADVRAQYRVSRSWLISAGIDNLNNYRYWAFHPYPQRTYHAELRFDL